VKKSSGFDSKSTETYMVKSKSLPKMFEKTLVWLYKIKNKFIKMRASFSPGLKFHHQHLELNSHPKDLHRDYQVFYGNDVLLIHFIISVI